MTVYLDDQGRRTEVGQGLGRGPDRPWMSFYRNMPTYGTHRVRAYKALPDRATREEAQADLDAYAKRQGWRVAE